MNLLLCLDTHVSTLNGHDFTKALFLLGYSIPVKVVGMQKWF